MTTRQPFNCTWMEDGRILAASIPSSATDINAVANMGIRAILSLTRRAIIDCVDVPDALVSRGIENCHIPVPDGDIPDSDQIASILNFLDHCQQQNKPVMIHCRGGIGRTGVVLWLLFTHRGMPSLQALDMIWHKRMHCGPQNDKQRAFCGGWCDATGVYSLAAVQSGQQVKRVPFTYTWIESNRILIGSIPQLPEDYAALRANNIVSILTLTRRDPQTYPGMPSWIPNIAWQHSPIPDGGIADDATMLNAAKFINTIYRAGQPIYVHCRGGIGRSGTILQAYYILYRGMTPDQARDMLRVRRNYEGNATAADQGSPQREWIDALPGKPVMP